MGCALVRVVQFLSGELSVSCIYSLERPIKNFITNVIHYCCMEKWRLLRLPSITGGKFLESNSVCRLDKNRRQIKNPEGHESKCTALVSVYNTGSNESNVLVLFTRMLDLSHCTIIRPGLEQRQEENRSMEIRTGILCFLKHKLFKQTQNKLHILNAVWQNRFQDASV